MVEVDEAFFVIFPPARGVPAVGRTLIPDHVKRDRALGLPPAPSCVATVIVIVLLVKAAVDDDNVKRLPVPASSRETATVTEPAVVSNSNPAGAVRIMVPALISLFAPSSSTGPVKAIQVPPVVSAEMLEPPVAVVTVAVACAFDEIPMNRPAANASDRTQRAFCRHFLPILS